jgi:hypothetical protein
MHRLPNVLMWPCSPLQTSSIKLAPPSAKPTAEFLASPLGSFGRIRISIPSLFFTDPETSHVRGASAGAGANDRLCRLPLTPSMRPYGNCRHLVTRRSSSKKKIASASQHRRFASMFWQRPKSARRSTVHCRRCRRRLSRLPLALLT